MNTIKNLSPLFLLLLSFSSLHGQFNFTSNNKVYTSLYQPIIINSSTVWDDDIFKIPIGFTFNFLDTDYDSLTIEDGVIHLGKQHQLVVLGGADLRDKGAGSAISLSPISYQLEDGIEGKILKLEVRNAGFYDGFSKDRISFQVWLYENDFSIEYHYGAYNISKPALVYFGTKGPFVGVGAIKSNQFTGKLAQNNAILPTITEEDKTIIFHLNRLDETPPSGTVYRFTPNVIKNKSVNPLATNFSTLFQIGTAFQFEFLSDKPFTLDVFNLNGQRLPKLVEEKSAQVIHYDYQINNATTDVSESDKALSPN